MNDPSPSQQDLGLCAGDRMQGSGTIRWVEVARQGQLDTDVRDPVNYDSEAASGGPPGLGFLSTGGQGARDTWSVPRNHQSRAGRAQNAVYPRTSAGLSETSVEESFRTWGEYVI